MPKKAITLHNALLGEFGGKVGLEIVAPPKGKYGCFEVAVGGKLIHSKHTIKGHGKCETEEELDAIVEYIEAELQRRRPSPKAFAVLVDVPSQREVS